MIRLFERRTRISVQRIKKKKSPFIYKSYSKKPKHTLLKKRKMAEGRFRAAGFISILIASLFLVSLVWNIFSTGYSAFTGTQVKLPITFQEESVEKGAYRKIVQNALLEVFPEVQTRKEKRMLFVITSRNVPHELKTIIKDNPSLIGTTQELWLPASSAVSIFYKQRLLEESKRIGKINGEQAKWITTLAQSQRMRLKFNTPFIMNGDSREAEQAGVLTSTIGSFFTIFICILLAFPLGVATAIYLEEFAPRNWFTSLIEININNLAAIPSIIFGLLGLSIYLNFLHLPRSSALVGGMVLALLILPVIVISTRNALRAVPQSIRDAASALGATPTQVVFHHTLIYSLPGVMTGVILGIARAFGETAPLLMIGMVAFIADAPRNLTDPATTLPIQVYLWTNNPELGFVEKTAAAIMVLLGFMVLINLLAVYVRKRFEIKW
ncbi:MAG: phosphate ABC transporter permease PstA [Alphaproteobacteria bacterium]